MLEVRYPQAVELLADAEHDVTAYAEFPRAYWRKIASANTLEGRQGIGPPGQDEPLGKAGSTGEASDGRTG